MTGSAQTTGVELAGYRIEELAGRGGMGEVYRAYDDRLDRNVALKLLTPRLADDARFRERFLRESRQAAGIDHPNVIPVYEAGEADGRLYIAMRYVDGTDLRRVLGEERVLDPHRALTLIAPVAGALDAAHARGLIHRDVKPGNILIAADPEADPPEHVYLSDFGLTTRVAVQDDDGGPFSGTAEYAAPELVTGGTIDGRADVYALGCVLFECLTGSPPYRGDSTMAVLWGHVNDPVPAATDRNPELPREVDDVFRTALAKEPAERYSTCRACVEDARRALGVTGIEVPAGRRGRRVGVPAAALVVVAVAVLAAVLLTRGGGGETAVVPGAGAALLRIDPAGNAAGKPIRAGVGAASVAADDRYVWMSARRDASLWRYTPASDSLDKIPAVGIPGDIALYGGKAWVAAEGPETLSGNVTEYEAASGQRQGAIQRLACSLTAGPSGAWVAGCPDIQELGGDPLKVLRTVAVPFATPDDTEHMRNELADMTTGDGAVWALGDYIDRRVWRIDPRSGKIARIYRLGFSPQRMEVRDGTIWMVDQVGDAVVRIDERTGREVARIAVGRAASGLAIGAGSVWVGSLHDRTVSRIDPRSNRVVATIDVDARPRDLAYGGGAVWVVGDAS